MPDEAELPCVVALVAWVELVAGCPELLPVAVVYEEVLAAELEDDDIDPGPQPRPAEINAMNRRRTLGIRAG